MPSDIPMCLPLVTALKPTLINALTTLSEERSVKSTLDSDFDLIDSRALGLLLDHTEVCGDGIFDVFHSLFFGISLAVAAGKGRTMGIISIF